MSTLWRAVTGLAFLAVYVAACQVGSRITGRRVA
jgi:transcription initiation factor TFIIIB Brf1 subunit/transcription initiation factor TFIIB